ncbi:MAG: hypothetical protein ACLU4N_19405 [Butyricimonas faecihominis]
MVVISGVSIVGADITEPLFLRGCLISELETADPGRILRWNQAFEKSGFQELCDTSTVRDDPSFDPDNLKYSCVRYVPRAWRSAGHLVMVEPTGDIEY